MTAIFCRDPVLAYVALGANMGNARAAVRAALARLTELPDTAVVACSSLYRTVPFEASGPDFINAVAALSTRLPAPIVLQHLLRLEQEAGRERPFLHAPRTLDLDLLLYGDALVDSPRLKVPHPRMAQRAFVLVPLAEIAPELVTPAQLERVAGQGIHRLR